MDPNALIGVFQIRFFASGGTAVTSEGQIPHALLVNSLEIAKARAVNEQLRLLAGQADNKWCMPDGSLPPR